MLKSGNSRIDIEIKPISDKWRTLYIKCLRIYAENSLMNFDSFAKIFINAFCTRRAINRILFFPLYFVFWLIGIHAHLRSRKSDPIEEKTSRVHERENKADAAIDKISKPMFEVKICFFAIPNRFLKLPPLFINLICRI